MVGRPFSTQKRGQNSYYCFSPVVPHSTEILRQEIKTLISAEYSPQLVGTVLPSPCIRVCDAIHKQGEHLKAIICTPEGVFFVLTRGQGDESIDAVLVLSKSSTRRAYHLPLEATQQ